MPVDYSVDYRKWENIEVSDDEDDTHPKKRRLEARVQRIEEMEQKKMILAEEKKKVEVELREVKAREVKAIGSAAVAIVLIPIFGLIIALKLGLTMKDLEIS